MAVRKIEHVGVMVRDMEASIAFYRDVLGLRLLGTLIHNNPEIKLAFLGFEGAAETQVELISGYNPDLPREGKVHHLAFTVDDIEAEFSRLKELRLPALDEEITTLSNGARYVFFDGPDGERIELFQPGSR